MARKRKNQFFREMKESLEDALACERGEKLDLRVTVVPDPPGQIRPNEIRKIRKSLKASQKSFATLLNVSPQAVQSWEQGQRRPRNAALKLLAIARKNPHVLLSA